VSTCLKVVDTRRLRDLKVSITLTRLSDRKIIDFLRHFNIPPVGSGYRKLKSASEDFACR